MLFCSLTELLSHLLEEKGIIKFHAFEITGPAVHKHLQK